MIVIVYFSHLCYEGKVAVVSWVESTESDIFEAKEILMARYPALVLAESHANISQRFHFINLCDMKETHPWFGLVHHFDALVANLEDASRPLARLNPTSHLVHSLEK